MVDEAVRLLYELKGEPEPPCRFSPLISSGFPAHPVRRVSWIA